MKRLLSNIQQQTGLAKSEAIVVCTILSFLLIGWLGRSMFPGTITHDVEQADKVIELLDSMLASTKPDTSSTAPAVSTTAASTRPARVPAAKKRSTTTLRKVSINTASSRTLERLPGIGPATAKRIIEERSRRPFTSVDDVQRVKGIGPAKLEKMRAYIIVP